MPIEEIFLVPPMAVARLGGSDTPMDGFTWEEDPSQHGAGYTVIRPAISLGVQEDGSVQPFLSSTIQFRDGALLRPVAPFFEIWAKVTGQTEPVALTSILLTQNGGSVGGVTYTVTATNRKAARRTGDPSCAFSARAEIVGGDYRRHELLASSLGDRPLVSPERPIPMGKVQALRPVSGLAMGVDLSILRLRFTPAKGEVYGPPGATSAIEPDTDAGANRLHEIVPPANRILNTDSAWVTYTGDNTSFNNPEPSDTYDGADDDSRNNQSYGVVDDTCDALIEAVLVAGGTRFRAVARVFSAPPDFSPDRRPFVSLADDLIDRDPPAQEPEEDDEKALVRLADLFQRVFETVSLANVDAMRDRSIGGGQDGGTAADSPRTDDRSMTPQDQPYYRPDQAPIPPSSPSERLPYHEAARAHHEPLADSDDLALFLRLNKGLVKRLIRPPYGAVKDLVANPAATAASNPAFRDPRITRDTLHDMRMPPYMRDSDATALSLTRRQYTFLMKMLERMQARGTKKQLAAEGPGAQPLPTRTNAHLRRVVERRSR